MLKNYFTIIIVLLLLALISGMLLYRSTRAFDIKYKTFVNNTNEALIRTASQFNVRHVSQTTESRAKTDYEREGLEHILNMSRTNPKFYPFNGTGTTVDIRNKYDTNAFNSLCKGDKSLIAILPVYSAPGNFQQRKAIRETVGKDCALLKCRIFFIVAISLKKTLNREVKIEYDTKRDILIVNKIDTYRDLNNKVVAMLDWLIQYCKEPKYVIHFIDDTYPNLQYFIDHLRAMKVNRFILGHVAHRAKIFRKPGHKWYISKDELPYSVFPVYVVGTAYAFLNSDCQELRDHVHIVEYCWVEDVWFSGMLAKGANFTFESFKRRHPDKVPSLTTFDWSSYALIHKVSPNSYYNIYKRKLLNVKAS